MIISCGGKIMKIGIKTEEYVGKFGFDRGVERIAEMGYDTVDYSALCPGFPEGEAEAEFEKKLTLERKKFEEVGLEISQTHGPWRYPPRDATPEDRAERFGQMSKAIRGTAYLGCKNMVIHNIMPFGTTDTDPVAAVEMNREYMGRLAEVGKEYGVVVCMENMPFRQQALAKPADLLAFVKSMNTPWLRMCLDTGHCAVHGLSVGDAVRTVGKDYLYALHVHDNDGTRDRHWIPYTGVVDWEDFSKALVEIGYERSVSLESNISKDNWDAEELQTIKAVRKLAGRE